MARPSLNLIVPDYSMLSFMSSTNLIVLAMKKMDVYGPLVYCILYSIYLDK
jgi:hypothetical protein